MSRRSDTFRVAVKDSALEANRAVREFTPEDADVVTFASESRAVAAADRLSEHGSAPVRIQATAPQDPDDVDAYLIADPERRTRDPDGSLESGLTFDVDANQYGAIGEALVCPHRVDPPLLAWFARQHLDRPTDALRVEVDRDPDPIAVGDGGTRRTWVPDCKATVVTDPGGRTIDEYWCEIKAGGGSFEREQRVVMERMAREATVLIIRLDLDDLPDSYGAKIRTVEPDDGDATDEVTTPPRTTRLDDF